MSDGGGEPAEAAGGAAAHAGRLTDPRPRARSFHAAYEGDVEATLYRHKEIALLAVAALLPLHFLWTAYLWQSLFKLMTGQIGDDPRERDQGDGATRAAGKRGRPQRGHGPGEQAARERCS